VPLTDDHLPVISQISGAIVGRPTDPPEEALLAHTRCPECKRRLNSHGHPFAEGETIKCVTIVHEEVD